MNFGVSDLKNYFYDQISKIPSYHTLCVKDLENKYKMQSGRCAISGIKMRTSLNSIDSIKLELIDKNGEYTIDNIHLVTVGAAVFLSLNFGVIELRKFSALVNKTSDIFGSNMGDPCVQASIHSEYQFDMAGFKTERSSKLTFAVTETDVSIRFGITIIEFTTSESEQSPIARINALYTNAFGQDMFVDAKCDLWTSVKSNTSWSFSTTPTGSGSHWISAGAPTSAPGPAPLLKPFDERSKYYDSVNINIPLADPCFFEKIFNHVKYFCKAGRKFKPLT